MRMEFLKQNILELGKYFQTNCIEIDKSTYFTVIIGQITIYGILVTFYQFVVSYNGNNELVKKYLGVNVVEYYVKKKVVVFDKFISKRIFSFLFILEILYKPVSVLLGNKIDKCIYYMLNSIWYTISVLYFIVFTIMLKEFISCTLTIKNFSNINQNICLKKDIDNLRFKNSIKDKIYMENIELLIRKFECLFIYIKEDNNVDPETAPKTRSIIIQPAHAYLYNKVVSISFQEVIPTATIRILKESNGETVYSQEYMSPMKISIDMTLQDSGTYYIEIVSDTISLEGEFMF